MWTYFKFWPMKNIFRKLQANENLVMACLQIYQQLSNLPIFLRVPSNSKEVSYLSWWNGYPKHVSQIIFEAFVQILWIFPGIKLSWNSCSVWDKPGWLNWLWQFLCERLSSFNPEGFYCSYAWSCSLY